MIDRESIVARLAKLRENVHNLEQLQSYSFEEFSGNFMIYNAAEHLLQTSIECILDIGNHIISGLGLKRSESYSGIVAILGQEGIIPHDFCHRLEGMAGFRNILVHEYMTVDLQIVHEVLQYRLSDFQKFAEQICAFLRRNRKT